MEEIQLHSGHADVRSNFLDVLVTLAVNAKLLVAGSLLAGMCALGVGFMLPQTYESVAVLHGDQSHAGLMLTAAVLDPVIASLGLARDTTVEDARTKLRNGIRATVGRTDKLLVLTVSAHSPQQAQAIAATVLQRTYQEARPKGTARLRLETQLTEAKVRLKNAQDVGQSMYRQLDGVGRETNATAEVARGYAELLGATGAAQNQVSLLEAQLEGLSESQLIQAPTLPENASQPRKGLIAIGATLAAGLALLLFVFVRQSLRDTTASQTTSAQWLRIRKSLGLG